MTMKNSMANMMIMVKKSYNGLAQWNKENQVR